MNREYEPGYDPEAYGDAEDVNHEHGTCTRCGGRLFFSEFRICRPCQRAEKAKGEA